MAVENGVQNAELGYLLFPFEQYSNLAGKPLVGGHMEIYEAGTDTKYISYQNWDGAENPFRIPIPNDGRITVLADPTKTFDCYLYDSYNNLVCSRLNVQANVPGNINIEGADTILKNTDGTLDIYLRTLGNNVREYTVNTHNKVLDVQEPLYFVENSNTATVIGFNGDNYATTADLADKMDISKLEYNEDGEISAYDGSAFAGQGAGDPEVNDLVHSNSATWNDVSAKLDTTAFSTVSGDFLTAIPDNYATKDYVQSSVSSKLDSTAFSTVSGSFLTAHQDLSDYLTKASADGLYYPLNSNPSGYLTAHQDLSQYAKTEDLTAYQEKGDYYSASNPSGFLTKASADTLYQPTGDYATHDDLTSYQPVSAMTGYQTAGDYATHDDLTAYQTVEGMTAYQPSGNYADATALDGKVDTSSFTAFSSTTNEKIEYISGALSGSYELSAGSGIDITDYPNEQKTVISVTAQGGNPEVEAEVIAHSADWNTVTAKANADDLTAYQTIAGMTAYQAAGNYLSANALDDVSATWNEVTAKADATALNDYATTSQLANKLDTTAFSTVSGSFLTAHQSLDGYATTEDVESAVSSKLDTTAFSTVSGSFLTAHQDLSDYATTAELADKLDTSAFSDVSGTFLTAHQDLSDYQTTAGMTAYQTVEGMTAYQPSGDYASATDIPELMAMSAGEGISISEVDNKILIETSGLQPSGNYLTAVPETYLQNTDLTTEDGKITAISGIPLSAGGDVPEGVMVESGLEYNAVNEISGYNGSAFAQYGAEKQWLTHDDTIVHVSNSAQYAFGVNLSGISADLVRMMGLDETVLWTGTLASGNTATISENVTAFNKIRMECYCHNGVNYTCYAEVPVKSSAVSLVGVSYWPGEVDFTEARIIDTTLTCDGTIILSPTQGNKFNGYVTKVIGIGRKN